MKDNCFKSKFFGSVQVNLQGFVGIVIYESQGVA